MGDIAASAKGAGLPAKRFRRGPLRGGRADAKPFGARPRGSKRGFRRVRLHARRAAIWAGRGIFKGTALVAAFALIVAIWF